MENENNKEDVKTIDINEEAIKSPNDLKEKKKNTKILFEVIFWIISVLIFLLGFIGTGAGDYGIGLTFLIGAIIINPLLQKIKFKSDKISKQFNIIRKILGFCLILLGFVFLVMPSGRLRIQNNTLANSHKAIINVLNDRLKEKNEKIEGFEEVEVNNIGKENNYKIYETKLKSGVIIQIIENDAKIEAIRTYLIKENEEVDQNSSTLGFIIGVLMNECGVSVEDGYKIIDKLAIEIENNNPKPEVVTDKFTIIMQSKEFSTSLTMVYNDIKIDLIENVNSVEFNIFEEKKLVEEINNIVEDINKDILNKNTEIKDLKELRESVKEFNESFEDFNFILEENINKKESWKNKLADIIKDIDARITIKVPNFNTMSFKAAESWGDKNNVSVNVSREYSNKIANNKLISQDVKAGEIIIKEEDSIKIIYSLGKEPTMGQSNALKKAESYSENFHMSKKGIYKQLISEYGEGFTVSEAKYAIEHIVADWKYNALKKAESYSENFHMSKSRIYQQLISPYGEEFTPAEAKYAIDRLK